MFAQLVTILMIVSALVGGSGAATVYASQASLPGELLYPVKTWSEDVRMDLTSDPESDLDLNLEFADRRVAEIVSLLGEGETLSPQIMLRLQTHLDQALQYAVGLEDSQAMPALQRVEEKLMVQQQLMLQLQTDVDPQGEQLINQTRQMLQERIQVVESQLNNQNAQQQQNQQGQQGQPAQGSQDQTQQQDRLQDQTGDQPQLQDQTRDQLQDQQQVHEPSPQGDQLQNGQGPGSGQGNSPNGTPVPEMGGTGQGGNGENGGNGNKGGNK